MKHSEKNGEPDAANTCPSATTTANAACGTPPANPSDPALLDVFIPGKPIPKGSMRHVGNGRVIHDNTDLKRWMRTIDLVARRAWNMRQHRDPIDAPVVVEAVFYMPRPKRPRWARPATKPDCDKLQRAIGDGLESAGVLRNDSRIVEWYRPRKYYADPQHPMGARIKVWAA